MKMVSSTNRIKVDILIHSKSKSLIAMNTKYSLMSDFFYS